MIPRSGRGGHGFNSRSSPSFSFRLSFWVLPHDWACRVDAEAPCFANAKLPPNSNLPPVFPLARLACRCWWLADNCSAAVEPRSSRRRHAFRHITCKKYAKAIWIASSVAEQLTADQQVTGSTPVRSCVVFLLRACSVLLHARSLLLLYIQKIR